MAIKDINFTDIYLGENHSWLSGGEIKFDPIPAPPDTRAELDALRKCCEETEHHVQKPEFAVRFDDVTYRVSVLKSMSELVYVLRRFPREVPHIDKLNLRSGIVNILMQPRLTGLVVVAGAFGQGKTTTASSLMMSRLVKYGGVGITVEDPPEMPLEGLHGEGICYQTWADQGRFSDHLRQVARWAPSVIMVGEVRDPETATEALRASINGRLVICTTHADNAVMAVERIYSLANGRAGTSDDVASLLANGLACILHQKLGGDPKFPTCEFLNLKGDECSGARNMIRNRKFEQLGSEITLQMNRMRLDPAGGGIRT